MINKVFDIVLDIILILCVIVFIIRLIIEIKTMVELEYPGDCVKINDNYYCQVRDNKEKNII